MKITDTARDALKSLLAENEADGLLVGFHETCCGTPPLFQLAAFDENDTPETINEIGLVIPDEAKDALEDLIIDVVNDELVVMSTAVEAGGCCGHHGHGDGGCCGGHEHHEEEGCCGGHGHGEGGCCGGH